MKQVNPERRYIKNSNISKRVVAILLLTMLVTTFVSQGIHVHLHRTEIAKGLNCDCSSENTSDSPNQSNEKEDNCPLCQFTLANFLRVEVAELSIYYPITTSIDYQYITSESAVFTNIKRGRSPPIALL